MKIYTSNTNSILIEHEDNATDKVRLGTFKLFNNESYILGFSIYYFENLMLTTSSSTLKKPKSLYL
jgi:hypothetical protein